MLASLVSKNINNDGNEKGISLSADHKFSSTASSFQ